MASLVNAKGVDISSWNGDIDLSKVKKAGYNFVMIRCGWGNNSTSNDMLAPLLMQKVSWLILIGY